MPKLAPIKRKDLIKYFRQLGFDGPYSGGNHQFMKKDFLTVRIPNPHQGEISKGLLSRILKQADIDVKTWEDLRDFTKLFRQLTANRSQLAKVNYPINEEKSILRELPPIRFGNLQAFQHLHKRLESLESHRKNFRHR